MNSSLARARAANPKKAEASSKGDIFSLAAAAVFAVAVVVLVVVVVLMLLSIFLSVVLFVKLVEAMVATVLGAMKGRVKSILLWSRSASEEFVISTPLPPPTSKRFVVNLRIIRNRNEFSLLVGNLLTVVCGRVGMDDGVS